MPIPRIIPCLLLKGNGLVKGVKFRNHRYLGDPLNAVKIFNDKEVDELVFLDITATREKRRPALETVQDIADECYMPFAFGGGLRTIDDMRLVFAAGAEKIVLNTAAVENPQLIAEAAGCFGSQSVVVAIDVKRGWTGKRRVHTCSGTIRTDRDPVAWAVEAARLGAGEILLTSIDAEGSMFGYDLDLIRAVAKEVAIPVIAAGGAGSVADFRLARDAGASAMAAGSMFVFTGKLRGILISYPTRDELHEAFR